MAEHTHGKMDIRNNEKTFAGFIRMATWAAVVVVLVLIFMALVNA